MPCWPDLWNYILRMRWVLGGALVIVAMIVLLLRAPGIRWRWARIALRVFGAAIGVIILVTVGFGALLASGNPEPQYRKIASPSGVHEVTLMYSAGFLGRDFTSVKITNRGCCQHFTAYEYAGPSDADSTTMKWLDDSRLEIRYYPDPDRSQQCKTRVAGVTIICTPMKRSEK